jgi:hypothetical protein
MTDDSGRRGRRPFFHPPAPLWVRPDAHLWIRPDADCFMPLGWRDQDPCGGRSPDPSEARQVVRELEASPVTEAAIHDMLRKAGLIP